MTFLPLAHILLGAVAPLLSPSDSGNVIRPVPAPTPITAPATPAPTAPVTVATLVADTTSAVVSPMPTISTIAPLVDAGASVASPLEAPFAAAALAAAPAPAPVAPVVTVAAPALAAGGWTFAPGMVRMPSWVAGTRTGLLRAARADSVVVEKGEHRMTLFAGGEAVGTYQVAIGQKDGKKERIGDLKTPEGLYHIDAKNPNSRFHLALHVSYPNADDLARARQTGVPTGGDIMIHGLPNGQGKAGITHRNYDWTNGCVAVTDQEIEEIFGAVPVGTPVRIKP